MNFKKILKYLSGSAFAVVLTLGFAITGPETVLAAETYSNYEELSASEEKNVDYDIISVDNNKDMTVFTIHGGGISVGISDIVNKLVQDGKYNYYLFEGIKPTDNYSLHITSTKFDEPTAVNQIQNSKNNVSFIGLNEGSKFVYVGGQNKLLAAIIKAHLKKDGFDVKDSSEIPANELASFAGIKDSNIVNKSLKFDFGGAQVAMTRGLRDELVDNPDKLKLFVKSLDKALSKSWPKIFKIVEKILEE